MQISSNGLISFGSGFESYVSQSFPIPFNVIAPYWDDIDLRNKGVVRYATITHSHPTLSCLLDQTNDLIDELENVEFNATWLLVARWIDVCPFGDNSCFEVCVRYLKRVFACLFKGCYNYDTLRVLLSCHLETFDLFVKYLL